MNVVSLLDNAGTIMGRQVGSHHGPAPDSVPLKSVQWVAFAIVGYTRLATTTAAIAIVAVVFSPIIVLAWLAVAAHKARAVSAEAHSSSAARQECEASRVTIAPQAWLREMEDLERF